MTFLYTLSFIGMIFKKIFLPYKINAKGQGYYQIIKG